MSAGDRAKRRANSVESGANGNICDVCLPARERETEREGEIERGRDRQRNRTYVRIGHVLVMYESVRCARY